MAASCTNVGFRLENSNFHENDDDRLDSNILDRYFNQRLMMILPGVSQVQSAVNEILEEQIAYTLIQLPLYRLIEMPFVQAFAKKGKIYILSQDTRLECQNCVAVTPSGWLILHLTKDTFMSLGLEATKQTFMEKKNDIYTVKIMLLDESFRPGKNGYDKTLWCLRDRLDLTFDFHIAWVPHNPEVCSSSIGIYFSDICQSVKRLDVAKSSKILTSIPHPQVKVDDPEGSDGSCNYQDMFEWMGAVACGVEGLSNPEPSYVSSLICPDPNANCPRCLVFQASGFLPSHTILQLYKQLRLLAETSHKEHSFPVSLTVQGFKDSPVIRKVIPREFSIPGDSLYSWLFFPDDNYWFLTAGES